MATTEEIRLRLLLGEAIPDGGDAADTFFADATITTLLSNNDANLNLAAAEGWMMKAAKFAELMDQDRSGTNVKLSQKYRQAREMMNVFIKAAGESFVVTTSAFRAIAKVASLDESCDPIDMGDFPYAAFGGSDYVRVDALKRFRPRRG